MDSPPSLVRLALGGLLLDTRAFRAQRDYPGGVRRGLLLVALIGLAVGLAALIGDLGEYLTQPDPETVRETIYSGITRMPWYGEARETTPELAELVDQTFSRPGAFALTPTPLASALGVLIGPLAGIISWFIGGSFIHIAARAFGGAGSYSQTLAAYAVAHGVNLLGLVQVVPYAEQLPFALLGAGTLLGMIASYVAVRETHGLPPRRAFWAVLIGPLLLGVLLVGAYCCLIFVVIGLAGGGAS